MLLSASSIVIGILSVALLSSDTEPTRDDVIAAYRLVLQGNDSDGDGRISLSEWGAMVDTAFPADSEVSASSNYSEVRREMMDLHSESDMDRDGFITFDELIRLPLANFDCMDLDGNSFLSQQEVDAGFRRCASAGISIDFISEP